MGSVPWPNVGMSDVSAGALVRQTVARSVTLMLRHDPGARQGQPEAVHKLRTATRRLRSDLRTFAPLVDETWAAPLRTELAWLGAEVGAVRDVDVLIERLAPVIADLTSAAAVTGAALLDHFRLIRSDARAALLATLLSSRYTELLHDLVGAVEAPFDDDRPAEAVVGPLAEAPWLRLRRVVDKLPADPADSDLHHVRIRAKRCRYAAEAVAPVVGEPAERFAAAVEDLQDVLGDHQDTVMSEDALRRAAATHPQLAPEAWQLIDHERRARAELRTAWPAVWEKAADPELRSWMMASSPG